MIIVTNRNVLTKASGEICFGDTFNEKGPDELRLAEVTRVGNKWKWELARERNNQKITPSEVFFKRLQKKMRDKKKNCIFFIHGFNNDLDDVVTRCWNFEKNYNVEVIAFSWPANGGGIRGAASYLSDKRDARMSVNALDRCFEKLFNYLQNYRSSACDQSFNLVLHSMGNYLNKSLMHSSVYQRETLIFDNVVMLSADVNNKGHAEWIDRIAHRKRVYITINENDNALMVSRLKFGEQQLARLGHYTENLNSSTAVYMDFSDAKKVGHSHAYFEGDSIKNPRIKKIFHQMLNGEKAERGLGFDHHTGAYLVS